MKFVMVTVIYSVVPTVSLHNSCIVSYLDFTLGRIFAELLSWLGLQIGVDIAICVLLLLL